MGDAAVKLTELPRERFAPYRDQIVRHYAREKAEAGVWPPEEAEARAAEETDALLPGGTATEGHFLYRVEDAASGEDFGNVWFAVRDSGGGGSVWIYAVEIREPLRRKGYATGVLKAVEERAREMGAEKVELHVFGHNRAARALYEKLGYETTSLVMSRRLS